MHLNPYGILGDSDYELGTKLEVESTISHLLLTHVGALDVLYLDNGPSSLP